MTTKNREDSATDSVSKVQSTQQKLTRIWIWVGIIILGAALIYISGPLSDAIGIIIWTVVFVFILRRPVNWLERHNVNRLLGTTLAYIGFFALLALLLFLLFSPTFGLGAQFSDLTANVPAYFEAFQSWTNDLYNQYGHLLQNDSIRSWIDSATNSISGFLQSFAATAASSVVAASASIANIILVVGFALVIAFWMLCDLPKLGREAYRLVGERYHEDAEMLYLTVTRVVGGYLHATIIQCAIIGLCCSILFALLGVPSPAAIGIITGLLNIIPIVGPWLGGAIALIASVTTSPLVGLIALIGTIIIQQTIYTFVSPKLMGGSVDIHTALTFIALMAGSGIGTALSGLEGALVGALLSIPLVAIIKSLFVFYFERNTGRRIVSEDGVFFKGTPNTSGNENINPLEDATFALSHDVNTDAETTSASKAADIKKE